LTRSEPSTRSKLNGIPILFTIIETKEISPSSPLNRRLIQARNTQNKVLLSDFRSNDPIQKWLERELPKRAASLLQKDMTGSAGRCRVIYYKPKRDFQRKRGALRVQLEDLAKVRYAYLYDPWTVLAYVNQLWTRKGEEDKKQPGRLAKGIHDASGKYEKAFGSKDAVGETKTWTDDELDHAVFAIVVHEDARERIDSLLQESAAAEKEGRELTPEEERRKAYLVRARFHIVALAGEAYRDRARAEMIRLMADKAELAKTLERNWRLSLLTFQGTIDAKIVDVGRDSILRSPQSWQEMVRFYRDLQALTTG
jgi:hypothetical protein